jgi:type I restriction enzyme S subunit
MREGYKMTKLGEIPKSWEVTRIGDSCKTFAGGTPKRNVQKYYQNGTIPWVKSGEVDSLNIQDAEEKVTELAIKETAARMIQPNSILIALYGATAGKVGFLRIEACCNQAVLAVNSNNDKLTNQYIYHYLKSITPKLLDLSQGSGQPNLSKKIIDNVRVPLPPLPEQRKIASILSTLDEKINCIEERIQATAELKKGLMQQLLSKGIGHRAFKKTKLGEIPKSWEVEICIDIGIEFIDGDRGENYPKSHEFLSEGYCLFLSAKNVTSNGFKFADCQFITKEKDKVLRKGKLKLNDIVITTRGSVGHIALYDSAIPYGQVRLNSGMVIMRDSNFLFNKIYLYQLLKSPIVTKQLELITSGSAQPQLTIKGLKRLRLPIPSIIEQQKIASILSAVDEKLETLKNKKAQHQELKKGLMQQLLTGKMRVKVEES